MIEEARTNGSSALDLSRKGLTEIPASLFSLEGLKVYAIYIISIFAYNIRHENYIGNCINKWNQIKFKN